MSLDSSKHLAVSPKTQPSWKLKSGYGQLERRTKLLLELIRHWGNQINRSHTRSMSRESRFSRLMYSSIQKNVKSEPSSSINFWSKTQRSTIKTTWKTLSKKSQSRKGFCSKTRRDDVNNNSPTTVKQLENHQNIFPQAVEKPFQMILL